MLQLVAQNRSAAVSYRIDERYEAGISLTGSEIKSVRLRRVSLRGSFVKIIEGEAYVLNLKIDRYPYSSERKYDQRRTRKLLLTKREIGRLLGKASQKGVAIVPLQLYIKNNLAKLEIGVGKVKRQKDKRQELKDRELERQVEQELKDQVSPKYEVSFF